jgi:hypothetical protein
MHVAAKAPPLPADDVIAVSIGSSALTHGRAVGKLYAAAWAELLVAAMHEHDIGSTVWEMVRLYLRVFIKNYVVA